MTWLDWYVDISKQLMIIILLLMQKKPVESLATCYKTVLVDGSTDCGGRILVCTLLEDLKCSILNGLYSSSRPYSLIYIYFLI